EYYNLVLELEKAGCANLGSSSEAVRDTTDKYVTFKKLKGVRTPKTQIYRGNTLDAFPLIAKPRDGVSCEGLFLVKDENDLERVPRGYLLQEYIHGQAYSAGLLVGDETRILSINTQELDNFVYQGAIVPAPLELNSEDEEHLIRAIECFNGANGYVGVDFVYDEGVVVIEVNARPTTPIIAMEEVYGYNPAELILKNYLDEQIPEGKPKKRVIMHKFSNGKRSGVFVEFGGYSISLELEKLGDAG
ncbi:MAG: ATP-grasp domain-containing protein, partial [Candidatus Hydrothermarchaeales archaeon]